MTLIDIVILVVYCCGLLAIGFFFARKTAQSASQMFVAGRQSPWWISGMSAYMTMFSAGTFVVWGGIAYEFGFVAISISLGYAVAAFIVGYFMASRWRALGVSTAAEYIHLRFGGRAFQFYTWFKIFFAFSTGLALYALARVLCPLILVPQGWIIADPATLVAGTELAQLSVTWACLILGGIVIVYTMTGGLWAVLLTDTLQFLVLTLTVVVAVFLGLRHIGGFEGFMQGTPDGFLSITAADYTWLFLLGWMLVNAFQLGAEWQFLQRYFCVSKPADAKKALYLFGALYTVFPFFFMAPPMFYRVITNDAEPEEAFILMCREILPPGMIGMMIAALFSATASLVSSVLNVYASVLTDDVYKRSIRPSASEREVVVAGRIITVLVGVYMVAGSILIPALTTMRDWIIVFGSLIGPALLLPTIWGLFSTRIGQSAVWWCVVYNVVAGALLKFGLRANGWFGEVDWLQGLIGLVEANLRVTDLFVGIVMPLSVLLVLQLRATGVDAGWLRMEAARERSETEEAPSVVDARGPALIMVWCLGFLAVIMGTITLLVDEQRATLATATVLLIGLVAAFVPFLRKKPTSAQS
jgi:solute:Na+ symporter, SSS family